MSGSSLTIIREGDWNGDGLPDHLVAVCSKGHCSDYQVEIGHPGKEPVPVFNPKALKRRQRPQPGEQAYYSPEYFARFPFAGKDPTLPVPFAVRLAKPKPPIPYLGTPQLIDLCEQDAWTSDSEKECIEQAIRNPKDHTYQPSDAASPEDPNLIYFKDNGHPPLDPRYLLAGTLDLLNPELEQIKPPQPPEEGTLFLPWPFSVYLVFGERGDMRWE